MLRNVREVSKTLRINNKHESFFLNDLTAGSVHARNAINDDEYFVLVIRRSNLVFSNVSIVRDQREIAKHTCIWIEKRLF